MAEAPWFDDLCRALATGLSRKAFLKLLAASLLGAVAAERRSQAASAQEPPPESPGTEGQAETGAPAITHGIASGDITARSAVVWARAAGPARMQIEYDTDLSFLRPEWAQVEVTEATDFTGQVKLEGLEPDRTYAYRVTLVSADGEGNPRASDSQVGILRTAPEASASRPVSFVVGGDLGGMRYCRRPEQGYDIFEHMRALTPDFFVANGDMIYADWDCPVTGPRETWGWSNVPGDFRSITHASVDWTNLAQVREVYLRHWRYNRADTHFQEFLRGTPVYAQWDDHEVISDFGGEWTEWHADEGERPGYPNLVAAGREALFNFWPIDRDPADPNRLYRSFRWGRDLELFIADARSYRSRNDLPDAVENAKTLLGGEQLAWLKDGLASSTATWKVVSCDVPLSIPTGRQSGASGRDSWANGTDSKSAAQTGFERELLDLLRFLEQREVKNLVFVVTDVHFAQALVHEVDLNGDGRALIFHQFTSGPLSAEPDVHRELDPTLQPTLLYAEGGIFSFLYVRIERQADGTAHLLAEVRGEDGQPRPGSQFDLKPQ